MRPCRRGRETDPFPTFAPDWLPDAAEWENCIQEYAFSLADACQGSIETFELPSSPPRPSAITRALEYDSLLRTGAVNTQAELAKREGLTPARVSQVLKMLTLPPAVLGYIESLPEPQRRLYPERVLRPLLNLPDERSQVELFERLQASRTSQS